MSSTAGESEQDLSRAAPVIAGALSGAEAAPSYNHFVEVREPWPRQGALGRGPPEPRTQASDNILLAPVGGRQRSIARL